MVQAMNTKVTPLNMQTFKLAAFTLSLVAGFSTPGFTSSVEVETFRETAKVEVKPEKIVVMDIGALDTLNKFGVQPVGVPNKMFVTYLDDVAANAKVVGSLHEPDFEAIHGLEPDLVVVGGRSSKQFDAMKDIAPTIDMTIGGEDIIATAKSRIYAYGTILSREEDAAKMIADFDDKIKAARNAVDGKGKALIILTNGPKISAYGAHGRFGWLHSALDIPEAVEEIDDATHGEVVSFEFIRDANPDWLLVVDRSTAIGAKGASAEQTLDNALVQETTAWKKGQVVYLNSANIYIANGGVQAMTEIMDEIIDAYAKQ